MCDSAAKQPSVPMPRHEQWRAQYRASRYGRHLSQEELNRRIRDLLINIVRLTPEAKIGVGLINEVNTHWWMLWTHALEEMSLRHGPYPSGFTRDILHSEHFPDFVSELAKKAASVLS